MSQRESCTNGYSPRVRNLKLGSLILDWFKTMSLRLLLINHFQFAAASCTGNEETLNSLPNGYIITLDGATDLGNGFRVTGATGSLMVKRFSF